MSATSYINAFPVHSIEAAHRFYVEVMGCEQGPSTTPESQDYSIFGHKIVAHWVGDDYHCADYFKPLDNDAVPMPHFGLQRVPAASAAQSPKETLFVFRLAG